ncbi:hypothetical protein FDP41_004384 [Naegleria fowleri]|uniref:Reverse transcriptase domain-containing protein n=1 Tax=Naegleria fowleri TaxID=5763 RepID=A0A6A5BSW4_NAEFO|nr:uncharacterized protein FDP41_004384 [Naegleria fowleri]KAF0976485.1 hypothetical protein FDP41_004384 [Naegleria fowleri]
MNQISTTLNESHYDSFDALQKDISEMVNKFSFKDDKTNLKYINTINKKEIKTKEIELLHLVTQGKGQNIEEIEKLRNNIKVLYKETGADIKAKLSENFNKHDSSMIYQFDKHLKEKSIDWKNIQFSEEEIVHHFETKFTSVSKSSDFENPPSTVKKGPKIPQISLKTIKEAISRMKSNTPGLDSISFQIIRNLKDEHLQLIADQFENCIQQGNIPEEWKSGWVKLLPKRDIQKLNDIRPITILPIYYRILFNIIAYELRQWASKHINLRQQAFISHRNTMNHGLLLSSLAKKNKSSFLLVNLDIEGAYDSVEDHIIEKALTHCKFPDELKTFILNSYKSQILQLEIDHHFSRPFTKTRGIPQGCPLAPLIYDCITQLIIDKCIQQWKISIKPTKLNINDIGLLCFADDINLVSNRYCNYNERLDNISKWLGQLSLKINPSKSMATTLPTKSKMKPMIDGTIIPRFKNLRVLGHYPWDDSTLNEDIEKRILQFQLSLKYIPLKRMEITNIKKKSNKKIFMHNASPTNYFHLPITYGGLGIPRFDIFADEIRIKTALYLINNDNELLREVYSEGIKHENSIFKEMNRSMKKYKIRPQQFNNDEIFPKLKGKNFTIYTDGSNLNNSTGFGFTAKVNNSQETQDFSYKINSEYSHNVAELSAILTSLKILPPKSKAKIHTDSEISIHVLKNKAYNGIFNCFKHEYQQVIQQSNLNIQLIKVKGHVNKGNIKADELAKKGAQEHNYFDIKKLFSNQTILATSNTIIFDIKKSIQKKRYDVMFSQFDRDNSSLHLTKNWSSINLKFIKSKIDTNTKWSIWRNLTSNHIKQHKERQCAHCKCPGTLKHFIYYCPNTQCFRDFFYTKFLDITSMQCILNDYQESRYCERRKVFIIHHDGVMIRDTQMPNFKNSPNIYQNWPEIQTILTLLVGKCHTKYYENSRFKKPIQKQTPILTDLPAPVVLTIN